MKKLFVQTNELDERATLELGLSGEILMENAASKIANLIRKKFKKGSKILGVAGSGNNGADVIAALRMLYGDYDTEIFLCKEELGELAKKQFLAAQKVGVKRIYEIEGFKSGTHLIKDDKFIPTKKQNIKCVIDGIFGSGLSRELDDGYIEIINALNDIKSYKIACDVPSGLDKNGKILGACFRADVTVTMGARKLGLYSDAAKNFTGKIKVARLGVSDKIFQTQTQNFLLEKSDMKLPFRDDKNVNKGNFGHIFVMVGEHEGAARMSALAASAMGAGLVSVISDEKILTLDDKLMQSKDVSEKMNAGAVGMGLGKQGIQKLDFEVLKRKSLVLDADMCHEPRTIELLRANKNIVITPHPKEFSSLLNLAGFGELEVGKIQEDRFCLARKFSLEFKCVLLLKGANTIIAQDGKIYVMRYGTSALAKGGSGDVLSGLIVGLLAQGYTPLDAAITASLAHALSARKFKAANYALSPKDIIKGVKCLRKK
ncbi:NAD(P)H-hydrate dehydratase [Campylobacter sp. 7477a]|uniref:NAD(P)H-hydrate dehydratase n=1 Tax=Campylobacter sp. 7477a TaxID=2735741 RepID=UPI003014E9B3|nr:NAD(P)H-hydrate dehydratase [Campylobacter sp. 7477a]